MVQQRHYLVWAGPAIAAVALTALAAVEWTCFPPTTPLDKGSLAPYTLRAPRDLVLSLQDLRREEIREALERYLPIYDFDPGLLERRKKAIVAEVAGLPAGTWGWSEPDEPLTDPPSEVEREVLKARDEARVLEVKQLTAALFPLLEPVYREGVVADDQFPAREREVRIYADGRYRRVSVGGLHRFSELRPLLREAGQRFFFKTEARVREHLINHVLDRLPPNLTYAQENAKHIADISQVTGVKVELLHSGDVLARRHQVIDGRVHYALRAAGASVSARYRNRLIATLGLALAACLLLVLCGREVARPPLDHRKTGLLLVLLVLTAALDRALLLFTPIAGAALPLAVVPITAGVLLGRAAAILSALAAVAATAAGGVMDVSTVLVLLGSGLSAGFVTQTRRRGTAIVAGSVAGIAAVAIFAACVALGARDRDLQAIWTATQALGGGIAAGLLALLVLPVGERLVGRTSAGRLRAVCDYERPLLRELRRRAPATFAHSVGLANIAETAAEALGVEPMLARAGALYHDVGKMEHPERYLESTRRPVGPDTHVAAGLALCRRYRMPRDVAALVAQHHGAGIEGGEAPASLEAVVVMIAEAALEVRRRPGERTRDRVARVLNEAFAAGRLAQSGATQAELWRIQEACIEALKDELREEAHSLREEFGFVTEERAATDPSAPDAAGAPEPGAAGGSEAAAADEPEADAATAGAGAETAVAATAGATTAEPETAAAAAAVAEADAVTAETAPDDPAKSQGAER